MRARLTPLLLLVCALGCSRPSAPTLRPESAKVTAITPAGLDFLVTLEANNPNSIDLTAQSISAKVVLDGKYPMGTVAVPRAISLPANKATMLDVPVSATFGDLASLGILLAQSSASVAYALDGTVSVGEGTLSFSLPFRMNGVISKADLLRAAMQSIPGLPLRAP